MTEYEKALKQLEIPASGKGYGYICQGTAKTSKKAVEKQIPKAPEYTLEELTGSFDGVYWAIYCPSCGGDLLKCHDYCPSCGQHIDWKTEKEKQ